MAKDTLSLTGQTIQNIRFDAIVDEGGFGWVYRGRHLGLDEPVAIKCLKVQAAAPPAALGTPRPPPAATKNP